MQSLYGDDFGRQDSLQEQDRFVQPMDKLALVDSRMYDHSGTQEDCAELVEDES